jgi:hypothetical protein
METIHGVKRLSFNHLLDLRPVITRLLDRSFTTTRMLLFSSPAAPPSRLFGILLLLLLLLASGIVRATPTLTSP